MDFEQLRELVRVRYELRTLLAENRRAEARPHLDRLRALAAADEEERAALEPEIARWECCCAVDRGRAAVDPTTDVVPTTGYGKESTRATTG